nr:MAG TPA: hypothetical protein [Caudoviricetes sp.]
MLIISIFLDFNTQKTLYCVKGQQFGPETHSHIPERRIKPCL